MVGYSHGGMSSRMARRSKTRYTNHPHPKVHLTVVVIRKLPGFTVRIDQRLGLVQELDGDEFLPLNIRARSESSPSEAARSRSHGACAR
jgi:hypothetical protein